MKRLVAGISILILVLLVIGLVVHFNKKGQDDVIAKPSREPTAEILKQRGPRATESRLRDSAKQVEDPSQALIIARESLARVEKELAGTKDDTEKKSLERKKQLIEKAIARLTIGQ